MNIRSAPTISAPPRRKGAGSCCVVYGLRATPSALRQHSNCRFSSCLSLHSHPVCRAAVGIDDLAQVMGARLVVHGHLHQDYDGRTRHGIPVRGVGGATPWLLDDLDPDF